TVRRSVTEAGRRDFRAHRAHQRRRNSNPHGGAKCQTVAANGPPRLRAGGWRKPLSGRQPGDARQSRNRPPLPGGLNMVEQDKPVLPDADEAAMAVEPPVSLWRRIRGVVGSRPFVWAILLAILAFFWIIG